MHPPQMRIGGPTMKTSSATRIPLVVEKARVNQPTDSNRGWGFGAVEMKNVGGCCGCDGIAGWSCTGKT